MKPLIRLAPQYIRSGLSCPRSSVCMRSRVHPSLVRLFAAVPPDSNKPKGPLNTNLDISEPQLQVPSQPEHPHSQIGTAPSSAPSSQAYEPPIAKEHTFRPITSKDWNEIEAGIDPVPERDWHESSGSVPLNKDWPITRAEFDLLPPEEQGRLVNEEWRRSQLEYIRREKLTDHNHLHPPGEPFKMPMVAYHRGYAPIGTTPPPVQKIPWQLRRPWNWIRHGTIALFAGAVLATLVAILIQYQDEWKLRYLESKSPAPEGWPEKAREYYAVALRHKNEGELQLAAWALQRALVEAGYRWIIEPEKAPEDQRMYVDLANAWVIRKLMMWEIELKHWDKAIALMDGLSTAYEEETPLSRMRRSDILRILAVPTEMTKGVQSASAMLRTAISYAGYELPENPKETIVLPEGVRGNAILLRALEDYILLQLRHGLMTAKQGLPTLLSIAKVYRHTPYPVRDACAEGGVLLQIGEIMYALGHLEESFQWTDRAVKVAQRAISEQSDDYDRQRCLECVGNGSNSIGILYEVATEAKIHANLRNKEILRAHWKHSKWLLTLVFS